MTFNNKQAAEIENIIKMSLRNKLGAYRPETKHMPFHYKLLGKDKMALFSFIHSLNTTFGISIFEPVAESLAKPNFLHVEKQYTVGNRISEAAQSEIQDIMNDLTTDHNPDKGEEIERIRKVCRKGSMKHLNTVKVDLYLQSSDRSVHLFDLKTAKPNVSNFKDFKRTLLEWVAIFLVDNPEVNINSYIAIPYNPYHPEPYKRWTLKGMLDSERELKVAEEFWNFLGGAGTYKNLLKCFERAGIEMQKEIDDYFQKFNRAL